MNERIAKLYDQATILEGNGDYVAGELDPAKFAELIVKECANLIADMVEHREPASTYVDKIKERFLIEDMNNMSEETVTEEEKEFSAKFMEFEKQKFLKLFLLEKEFVINECKLLDSDGYPTHHALNLISNWNWSDSKGWFEFIKSIWWMPDWGWHEGDAKDEFDENKTSYRYNISTGGWSGNESIIDAMKKNTILWTTTWVQSRRGGHYIFELSEFDMKEWQKK